MSFQEWLLPLLFSPYKKICEVPVQRVQQELITVFKINGLPDWIKVDNGRPLGDPKLDLIPLLALWLIGFGIKVIWNRPATPQDNAVVERSQGVMANWTEFSRCKNVEQLQFRLWKEAEFHNYHFPIRRKANKKKIELFPSLHHTGREWNPADFNLKRALIFLAKGEWERKVSATGQINIYGQRFAAGLPYKHQKVSIKLNPRNNYWQVFDANGKSIRSFPTRFSEQSIWKLDLS